MFKGNNYFIAEIRDKEFVDEIIAVLLNSFDVEIDEDIKQLLKKMLEINYIDIAIPNTDLDGIMQREILYHIITSILQNKPLSVIREELLSNSTLNERVEYILSNYKPNKKIHVYIKPLKNKIKFLSLYKFLIKINNRISGITTDIKQNSDFESSVLDVVEDINTLYKEINFDKTLMEINISNMDIDYIKSFLNTYIDTSFNNNIIKTGIKTLDNLFNLGGFYKGNIYMFSAPYGTGKTRFLTILGGNMFLQGYNVLHITIENEKEEILRLYNNFIMEMDDNEIIELIKTNGIDFVANEIKSRFKRIKELHKNNLELRKLPYKSNPKDIENIIISRDDFKPDVILLDHVDLLYSNSKNDGDLFKRMEDVMSELKDMCEKYKVCMIIASQLNREGNKGRKDLSFVIGDTISRSVAKNELTSFHAILMQTFEESISNYIRIFIDKNRFGVQNVMLPLYFDKSKLYIEEILTEEDFEKYISSINNLLNNKNAQRIVNAMKMFINSINSKINDDLYEYKFKLKNTLKNISEIMNKIDENDENENDENNQKINQNTINDNIDIIDNIINNHDNKSNDNNHDDDNIIKSDFGIDIDKEFKVIYENKEYNYKEFVSTIENNDNKDNKKLLLNKSITNLSKLIDKKYFDNLINDNNDNNIITSNKDNDLIKNQENQKEIKNGIVKNNGFNNNISNNITLESYINKFIQHTNFNKIHDNYEILEKDNNKVIKLKTDTYYNVIEINKDVLDNLSKQLDLYYNYAKIDRNKIDKEELLLLFILLNGINHNSILNHEFGNIYTTIKSNDDFILEAKISYVNNEELVYEMYKDTIICEDDLITKDNILEIDKLIDNNLADIYIEKGSMVIITNTNNIYIITEEVQEIIKDALLKFYEKYKDMNINNFYNHYKNNIKLVDFIRENVGEYPFISINEKLINTFLHSMITMVYS